MAVVDEFSPLVQVGIPGSQTKFKCKISNPDTGEPLDDANYVATNAMPKVKVFDPSGSLLYDTNTDPEIVTRNGVGDYQALYLVPVGSLITIDDASKEYKFVWYFTIDTQTSEIEQIFNTSPNFAHSFGNDKRVGAMFGNPDYTSNYHTKGWGKLVTNSEIRYGLFFGNEMAAQNGDWYTSSMIDWYIDNAFTLIEEELNICIIPKQIRHRPMPNINDEGIENVREDFDAAKEDFVYEDPYDYQSVQFEKYIYIKLRRQPILEINKAELVDPLGIKVIDLLPWARPNYEGGSLQFYPNTAILGTLPLISLGGTGTLSIYPNSVTSFPDSFVIDYKAGYKNAKDVPNDIRQAVFNLAAWNLLNDVGDGRSAALASSSISLAGVSESFSTTQSATSALYGARLESIQKWMKKFYDRNRNRYSGLVFVGV